MRNARQSLVLFLALIAVAAVGLAASKSQPAFDKIKSLVGNWEGKGPGGGPAHINYKLVSGGTAVMESILESSEAQMVTLYYLDGDHLMMTHYCMANNQPRMRADASTSSASAIKFTFVDATNLSGPDAGHMHAHSIIWKDADHVTQQWTWREKGQEKVESFELARQK
ncbi:MAG TPA: hypothetical protein VKO18_14475 [Terriglobia bacterium]|nr:hypothetical protein [Terriglobia bacterium]